MIEKIILMCEHCFVIFIDQLTIDFNGFRILEADSQRCLCEGVDNFLSIILLATSSWSEQTTIT